MEHRLKSWSFMFMIACLCLLRPTSSETTSSSGAAALRSTSVTSEMSRNAAQDSEVSGWKTSLWGPRPDPSDAAALLLYQFSEGGLGLAEFESLVKCVRVGVHCPATASLAFLALSNCTTNTALPLLQCQAFNKCLSESEIKELFESVNTEDGNDELNASDLEKLLPTVVSQLLQCRTNRAAVRTHADDVPPIVSSRDVNGFSVNVTDNATTSEPVSKKPNQGEVWGYGILFVTLISLCSLVGVSVLPLMARAVYQQIMTGLVGLAVGSLAASAAFHLLPQAYKLPMRYGNHDYLFMSLYFLVGLWAFLMIERLIKISITMHSARRQQPSVVQPSPSAQGFVNSGSDALSSPCPSVTVLSVRQQVPSEPLVSAQKSAVDEMNRRNSNYIASKSQFADNCCILLDDDDCQKHDASRRGTFDDFNDTDFCDDVCCESDDKGATDVAACPLPAVAGGTLKAATEGASKLKEERGVISKAGCSSTGVSHLDSSTGVSHLGCGADVSRSCSNDISCVGVGCKQLEKEQVDLIFASQHQAIKASFGHEQKPAAGGHSHAAVDYHPGESSVIRTVAWMIIFGDGFHNFLDGVSIGAAFSVSKMTGISVSLAVMCEELPHELGDFAVLLNAGMSMKQALMYNFLSATTCYAGLVLGILLGEFTSDNSFIFALAAGMFIYISCVDMVPELNEVVNTACEKGSMQDVAWIMLLQNLGLMLGAGSLFVLAYYQDRIALD